MVDQTAVGLTFAPVHAHVEAGRLRYLLKTLDEKNPIYNDPAAAAAAGYSATPVPPTYLFCLEMLDSLNPFEFIETLKIDVRRILHGEQKFVYHAPVVMGDTLTFESKVLSVTDKKGGALTFVEVGAKVTNQRGEHVADTIRTVVVLNKQGA